MASDAPLWLAGSAEVVSAVSAVAALGLGIRNARLQAAHTWSTLVEEFSELSANELREAVENHPWVAEVVGLAWEEAARTSNEHKRRLLARVAVTALRYGPFADKVESVPFLIRTVANLEPPHIQAMIAIATDASLKRASTTKLESVLTTKRGPGPLVVPIYGQLQREGLTQQIGKSWEMTEYGWEFLAYLAEDEPAAQVAYVDFYAFSRDGRIGTLVLMNYGTASATVIDIQAELYDQDEDQGVGISIPNFTPLLFQSREQHDFDLELSEHADSSFIRTPILTIRLQWELLDGRSIEAERKLKMLSFDKQGSWLSASSMGHPPV